MTDLATMSSVCPDWTLQEVVDGMKRHGYKGFEPRVEWHHASGIEADLSAEARAETKRVFADEGLKICCVATSVRMAAPDADERAGYVEDLRRYIQLAADLDCQLIRTFGGPRAGGELIPIVDYTADGYRQITADAESAGVTVLMETHDDWCASASVRAVVEAVDSPRVKVLWDFMHPQRMMERPEESFANLGALTAHVHAHDGSLVDGRLQVGPLGEGIIDHETPLHMLEDAGFDGYFSVEVIHKPGSDHDADGVLANYAEGFNSYQR
jgi:sugar phosphate isomerase/epimerase